MSKKASIVVACTQNPSVSFVIDYDEDLLQDLRSIKGFDIEKELKNVLQQEADHRYDSLHNKG